MVGAAPSRLERRKQRTRAALVEAARQIYAERGTSEVSIQQITDRADVGFGSFYNHFASKTALFEVAVAETLETHAAWLADVLAGEDDPAAVFATSMRLTGRLVRTNPPMAQILMKGNIALLWAPVGHAPHARRDIEAAVAAGRFVTDDLEVALACTAGCLVAAMQLASSTPGADVDQIADQTVLNVLRMFGMDESDAQLLIRRPLPGP